MKANELRINNIVNRKFLNPSPTGLQSCFTDVKIKSIGIEKVIYECKDKSLTKVDFDRIYPIKLTEFWLLKFEFEKWDASGRYSNEFEKYERWVLHNRLDGTSNFEVHLITSTYGGGEPYLQTVCSIDEDERINTQYNLESVHQLQNLFFALTAEELIAI